MCRKQRDVINVMVSSELLKQAVSAHQSGRLVEAQRLYERLLAEEPRHADALHLMGVLSSQSGRFVEAVDWIGRAIAERPDEPTFHVNLAMVYERGQRTGFALQEYQRAVDLYERRGNHTEASQLRQRLAAGGAGAGVQYAGREERANSKEAELRRAVELNPSDPEAKLRLGSWLMSQRRCSEALPLLREAAELKPDSAAAHMALGAALHGAGRESEAFLALDRAAELAPDDFAAQLLAVLAVRWTTDSAWVKRARRRLERAVRIGPKNPQQWNQLGAANNELLQVEAACACYERAIELSPDFTHAHWNLGMTLLLRGQLEKGWQEFEWRTIAMPALARRGASPPRWHGEDVKGRALLLYTEGGLGDALHFIRYAPLVQHRGARVVVECHPSLVSLIRRVQGVEMVVARGTEPPPCDFSCPLQSLPGIIGTTMQSIPGRVPYLFTDPLIIQSWRSRFADFPEFRVGLVWAGSEREDKSVDGRSRSLALFEPLSRVRGVKLFSLQTGPQAVQLQASAFALTDVAANLIDFSETAGLIESLDLVISVDTSVAHLAGGLGRPVWVLVPSVPDFRWLLDRSDSPWYPTMRLYRQELGGSWESVVARIATDLAAQASSAGLK